MVYIMGCTLCVSQGTVGPDRHSSQQGSCCISAPSYWQYLLSWGCAWSHWHCIVVMM
jgi:hypothetical protein